MYIPRGALTISIPTHVFASHLRILDAFGSIFTRLRLQNWAEVIDAVTSQGRVHATLQGVAFPTEEVVSVLAMTGAVEMQDPC